MSVGRGEGRLGRHEGEEAEKASGLPSALEQLSESAVPTTFATHLKK
jgi:hypothetical protein